MGVGVGEGGVGLGVGLGGVGTGVGVGEQQIFTVNRITYHGSLKKIVVRVQQKQYPPTDVSPDQFPLLPPPPVNPAGKCQNAAFLAAWGQDEFAIAAFRSRTFF